MAYGDSIGGVGIESVGGDEGNMEAVEIGEALVVLRTEGCVGVAVVGGEVEVVDGEGAEREFGAYVAAVAGIDGDAAEAAGGHL